MSKIATLFLLFFAAFGVMACEKEESYELVDPVPFQCDSTHRPVVMVHGFLASGDTYSLQYQRFTTNGYCGQRIFVFDWNTLAQGADNTGALDAFIDAVLAETGADRVDLAGHSAGSGLCYNYLSTAARAAKVAHYAHLAGNPPAGAAGPNGEIPTVNIYSNADLIVTGGDAPGCTNINLVTADHYQVATSAETFRQLFRLFNDGEEPLTTEILPEAPHVLPRGFLSVSGRAVTLGENTPVNGGLVEVYEVDPATGGRLRGTPDATFTTSANGSWGPFRANARSTYEFRLSPGGGARPVIYYRERFKRSNELVYLRSFPTTGLGALLLSSLPSDDNQSVVAVFASSQAVIDGRDELFVDNLELSTPDFADADKSAIAFFCYDNGNGTTEATPVGLFGNFPFLSGVDVFIPTAPAASVHLRMNGRSLMVPNRRSASEGVIVAVFD
jgi:hypothetical protein